MTNYLMVETLADSGEPFLTRLSYTSSCVYPINKLKGVKSS